MDSDLHTSSTFPYRSLFFLTLIVSFALGIVTTLYVTRGNSIQVTVTPRDATQATQEKIVRDTTSVNPKDVQIIPSYPNIGMFNGFQGINNWVGEPQSESSLKGHVTLIAYIVHYQTYSQRILPILQDMRYKYSKQGLEVILINNTYFSQNEKNSAADIKATLDKAGITYPTLIDQENITTNYAGKLENVNGWPSVAVVDKHGNVRYLHNGAGEYDKLYKAVDYALQDQGDNLPTVETIVEDNKQGLLQQNNLDKVDHIEYNWVTNLSDTVHQISITLAKKPKEGNIRLSGDIVQTSLMFGLDKNNEWVVGLLHDPIYCMLLNQPSITDAQRKQYAYEKCK